MDRSDVIKLIKVTKTQDKYGVWREELTPRQVYCDVSSVSAAEFFEGGRNGLNPYFRMTVFFADYEGETLLEYQGSTYSVYRTYKKRTDEVELYVERKGGSNGKEGDAQQSGHGD